MPRIELSRGLYAIIDDGDYNLVAAFKWYATQHNYARRNITMNGKRTTITMHRFIMNVIDKDIEVDHIDGNPLNNCRSNLRCCKKHENRKNRTINKNSASGFKGVTKANARWEAQIAVNKKKIYLGSYATPEEAALAYDAAAIKFHKSFAKTNF